MVMAMVPYYDKILHKQKACYFGSYYLGSGDFMLQSTQINHIEHKFGKRPVSCWMCEQTLFETTNKREGGGNI